MTTLLYTHPACLDHDPGDYHPEVAGAAARGAGGARGARVRASRSPAGTGGGARRPCTGASAALVERLLAAVPSTGHVGDRRRHGACRRPRAGRRCVPRARSSPRSTRSSAGEADNAFCAVRPPGHHAEPRAGDGLLPVQQCRDRRACGRASVHGLAARRGGRFRRASRQRHAGQRSPRTPTCSMPRRHQSPLLSRHRRATRDRASATSSTCRCRRCRGSRPFRRVFSGAILPALDDFRPELLHVSAGFDAHRSDPLAQLLLDESDYTWVTEQLVDIARQLRRRTPRLDTGGRLRSGRARRQRRGACTRADGGLNREAALLQCCGRTRYYPIAITSRVRSSVARLQRDAR